VKDVYRAHKAVFQFGHLRQGDPDLLAADLANISDAIGTEASGILGYAMLHFLNLC